MFGVGLHFSLKDLLSVRGIAIPGAIVQIAVATALGAGLALLMGWSVGGGLVFGLALSVASTVVLLRALQERRLIETERGRIAVGWLIVEDLAMVLALVLLPALGSVMGGSRRWRIRWRRASGSDLPGVLAVTLVKVAAFVGLMLLVGRRVIPWILHVIAHTGSRELFRLGVLAIALGVAFGAAKLFGVSFALGAFFAGMVLGESELSQRAGDETLPLRDAFSVLFFVSVGMLFDPLTLLENPLPIIATLFIIVIGKSVAAFLIVLAFRRPVVTALTISASLAQIGEFSFILADARGQLCAAAGGGPRPDPRRRDPVDLPQSAGVPRHRPADAASRAQPRGRSADFGARDLAGPAAGRRPAREWCAAADRAQRSRRPGRLWPGRKPGR